MSNGLTMDGESDAAAETRLAEARFWLAAKRL